jgi:hypothetical protein
MVAVAQQYSLLTVDSSFVQSSGLGFASSGRVGITWCRIARAEQIAAITADEVSPLDELFFSLDGTTVASEADEWRIEVSGIHFGSGGRWLQLNLCGDVTYSVTVKIDTVDAGAIRENLAACLPCDTPSPASLGSI